MAVEAELYNNGDFVCFDLLQEQQQVMTWQLQQQQQEQQLGFQFQFQFQSMGYFQNGNYSNSSSWGGADVATTMEFSESVSSLLEKQNQEFDWALQIQNERLRRTLHESSTQNLSNLLQKYEPYLTALISQKDQIISAANKNNLVLENYLKNIELEIDTWQTKARESEAEVADLNNALRRASQRIDERDEESRCDYYSSNEEMARCRMCKSRRSCVVLLPCRHLCCCEFCECLIGDCPVCETAKESSMEVLLE